MANTRKDVGKGIHYYNNQLWLYTTKDLLVVNNDFLRRDVVDFLWNVIYNVIIGAQQTTVVDQQLIMNI